MVYTGPYRYLRLDALTQKVRATDRGVNVGVVVATGVNVEGKREVLGLEVGASEGGVSCLVASHTMSRVSLSLPASMNFLVHA